MDELHTVGEYKIGLKKEIVYDRETVEGIVIAQWKNLKQNQISELYIRLYVEESNDYQNLMISGKNCLLEKSLLVWRPEFQNIRIVNGQVLSLVQLCIPVVRNHYDVHKLNLPQELKAKLFEEIIPFSFKIREGFPPTYNQLGFTHRFYVSYQFIIVVKSSLSDPSPLFLKDLYSIINNDIISSGSVPFKVLNWMPRATSSPSSSFVMSTSPLLRITISTEFSTYYDGETIVLRVSIANMHKLPKPSESVLIVNLVQKNVAKNPSVPDVRVDFSSLLIEHKLHTKNLFVNRSADGTQWEFKIPLCLKLSNKEEFVPNYKRPNGSFKSSHELRVKFTTKKYEAAMSLPLIILNERPDKELEQYLDARREAVYSRHIPNVKPVKIGLVKSVNVWIH